MLIYNESTDVIIWNDNIGVAHVIRTNTDYKISQYKPFSVESFSYDDVRYLSTSVDMDGLKFIITSLISDSIIDPGKRGDKNYKNTLEEHQKFKNPLPGARADLIAKLK